MGVEGLKAIFCPRVESLTELSQPLLLVKTIPEYRSIV